MAVVKKKARRSTAAADIPTTDEAGTDTAEAQEAQESSSAPSGTTARRSPKGPSLSWDPERDKMLVKAIASGIGTTRGLAEHLAEDENFRRDLPADAIIPTKIATRLRHLRSEGVNIPSMSRSASYSPDVDALNSILGD